MKAKLLKTMALTGAVAACSLCGALELDEHTVGLWNFNEGTGTVIHDQSSGKNDLHISGAPKGKAKPTTPKWVVTPDGQGLLFRAEDRKRLGGRAVKLTNQVTCEMWLKPVKYGKSMGLYGAMQYCKNGFRTGLGGDLKIYFNLEGKGKEIGVKSKQALKSGEWSHVACTYDGQVAKVYINGKLDNERALVGYDLSGVFGAQFGYTGGTPYFNGILDSLKVSDIALSDFSQSLASFKNQ
jgi:hypothetical protein